MKATLIKNKKLDRIYFVGETIEVNKKEYDKLIKAGFIETKEVETTKVETKPKEKTKK